MNELIGIFKRTLSTRLNRTYFVVFLISFTITEMGRGFYRPYIYRNNLNDLGFADTVGNTFGTITLIFFILSLVIKDNFRKEYLFIPGLVGILIIYELFQELLPGSSFDWKDVIATIMAGVFSFLIHRSISRNDIGADKTQNV